MGTHGVNGQIRKIHFIKRSSGTLIQFGFMFYRRNVPTGHNEGII
jgi:hypothetical protein